MSTCRPLPRSTINRTIGMLLASLGVVAVLGATQGCYRRVVGAKGFGADTVQVSESYQENQGWLDRKIFGESKKKSGSRLSD